MFNSLSPREQKLVIATLIVVLVGVGYIGLNWVGSSSDDTEVSEATARHFEDLFVKMASVEDQKSRNLWLRKTLGNEKGTFASEKEISRTLAVLEQVAGQSGVQLTGNSQVINQRSKPYPTLEIKLGVNGEFRQFVQFLDLLKKADILVQPVAMKAALKDKNQPRLEVQMTLTTYLIGKVAPKNIPTTSVIAEVMP